MDTAPALVVFVGAAWDGDYPIVLFGFAAADAWQVAGLEGDMEVIEDEGQVSTAIAKVRSFIRGFGYIPKCYSITGVNSWLMVYENKCAPLSKRYFLGVFEGESELRRQVYRSDMEARKDFEKRVEALTA